MQTNTCRKLSVIYAEVCDTSLQDKVHEHDHILQTYFYAICMLKIRYFQHNLLLATGQLRINLINIPAFNMQRRLCS
jgi:hypothetical protein